MLLVLITHITEDKDMFSFLTVGAHTVERKVVEKNQLHPCVSLPVIKNVYRAFYCVHLSLRSLTYLTDAAWKLRILHLVSPVWLPKQRDSVYTARIRCAQTRWMCHQPCLREERQYVLPDPLDAVISTGLALSVYEPRVCCGRSRRYFILNWLLLLGCMDFYCTEDQTEQFPLNSCYAISVSNNGFQFVPIGNRLSALVIQL